MSDLIERQRAMDALRKMQTYKLFSGDDMLLIDQAGAMTELMLLPPAELGTNLAEVGTDCISRQAAIDELVKMLGYCFQADEEVVDAVVTTINELPSAQSETIVCEDCKWRIIENRKTTSLWLPCRALVTPDEFSCIYAERREVTE